MVEPNILCEVRNNIGYIPLNRPKAHKGLTKSSLDHLVPILSQCKGDDSCRPVIITEAGNQAFSAETDINTFLREIAKPMGGREWSRYEQAAYLIKKIPNG